MRFGFSKGSLARCCASATVSLLLCGVGCGGRGHAGFIAPPDEISPSAGRAAVAGGGGSAGAPTEDAGDAGALSSGNGGEAGSTQTSGDAGASETDGGRGNAGSGGGAPLGHLPSAPTGLLVKAAGATSIRLSWSDNADNETGYNVYWAASATKPAKPGVELAADATNRVVDALTTGREYHFWVEAFNDLGASADVMGSAVPGPVPAAPTGLTIEAGSTDAMLKWTDRAVDETGYRIYFATSDSQPAMAQYELPADTETYTVPGSDIDPYKKYYYWVVAYNGANESMPATGSATTGLLPATPSGVAVDDSTSFWSVTASWRDNSEFSSSFNVYWSTDDTKPALPQATAPGSATTYVMKSALGNQKYRFWIESVNPIGTSAPAQGTANTLTDDLVWTELYYDLNAKTIHQTVQDTFGLLGDSNANTGLYAYHTTTTTLGSASTLTPGISWNPDSAGIDITQTQSFWAEARTPLGSKFSVRKLVPPGAMTPLTATATNLSVALSWAAVTPVSTYQVFVGSSDVFANAASVSTQTGLSIQFPDMNPGTTYNFWVRPIGSGFNGSGFPGAPSTKAVTTSGSYVGPNLALKKTAVASSKQSDAAKVVDGNLSSRWQAASTANNEWIYVNLGDGNAKNITHVKLVWEASYATSYDIQVCAASCDDNASLAVDSWAWVTAYSGPITNLTGFPNYQLVALTTPTIGQFIRMKPKTLASAQYGASLWEFEVFSQSP